jgi:hypothetical protein
MKKYYQILLVLLTTIILLALTTIANAEQIELYKNDKISTNNGPVISGFVKRFGSNIHYADVNLKGIGITSDVELNTISSTQGFYTFTSLPTPEIFDQLYEITASKEINGKEFKGSITVLITQNDFAKTGQDINLRNPRCKSLSKPFMNLVLKNFLLKENLLSLFTI